MFYVIPFLQCSSKIKCLVFVASVVHLWISLFFICLKCQQIKAFISFYPTFSATTWPTHLFGQCARSHPTWCPGISLCSLCCWSWVWFRWHCVLCRWWTAFWELFVGTAVEGLVSSLKLVQFSLFKIHYIVICHINMARGKKQKFKEILIWKKHTLMYGDAGLLYKDFSFK